MRILRFREILRIDPSRHQRNHFQTIIVHNSNIIPSAKYFHSSNIIPSAKYFQQGILVFTVLNISSFLQSECRSQDRSLL